MTLKFNLRCAWQRFTVGAGYTAFNLCAWLAGLWLAAAKRIQKRQGIE